jgi:hypothetical protein
LNPLFVLSTDKQNGSL